MPLSKIFESITRMLYHVEKHGYEGFRLWRSKQGKKQEICGYKLSDLKHELFLRTASSDYATYRQVFIEKQYDCELGTTPEVIIDCGANIGLASVFFANKYPSAKIIAIEPERSNFEMLKRNTQQYPNVHCLNNGIWSKKVNLRIYDAGLGSWNFVVEEVDYQDEKTIAALSIPDVMTMFNIQQIDLLKMDIEGSEKEVFSASNMEWLNKVDYIVIELHDWMKKGTAKVLFDAIRFFNYYFNVKGENVIIKLKN